jgi:hypothetical protein
MHDWTRVPAGIYHHLHGYWIGEVGRAIGPGKLPMGYSALIEQVIGRAVPDVPTVARPDADPLSVPTSGGLAVRSTPPAARHHARAGRLPPLRPRKRLVVRHNSDGRMVAVVELMSPGNKASRAEYRRFVGKAVELLRRQVNLAVVDPFPPTARDPNGVHADIWAATDGDPFELPPDRRLTLASYDVGDGLDAYVTPFGIGDTLPDMPLFLAPGLHVLLPLEATYQAAWAMVPEPWSEVLAAP